MTSVSTLQFPEPFLRYLKQHMTQDHQELDEILEDVATLAKHRDFFKAAASARFAEFRARQEQHMAAEEAIALPLLEAISPDSPLPTQLRAEHAVILQGIKSLARAISSESREGFDQIYTELAAALKLHNQHEDELLASALRSAVATDRELLLKIACLHLS